MTQSVILAFDEFMRSIVNLDSTQTSQARTSRDWLHGKILEFPNTQINFPDLYEEMNLNFGSFARKTKKRPLDDIDMMICLHGDGSNYAEYGGQITINVPNRDSKLRNFLHDGTECLNSIRIVNKFVSALTTVPQYRSAGIKRNQEAAVLQLVSYVWDFDIVPSFYTTADLFGRNYYIIPDGNGHWKKTDPRVDQNRVSRINQANSGNVLNVIRAIKYWNSRSTMPSASSYLLETLILNYYEYITTCSKYVDIEIPNILSNLSLKILTGVADPKGIVTDINNLSWSDRIKISNRATSDRDKALQARQFEIDKNPRESINKWREIFGDEFPQYS